jgi:hypothetical protein
MRESTTASVRSTQSKEILIKSSAASSDSAVMGGSKANAGVLKIPKGTLILASVAVNTADIDISISAKEVHPLTPSPLQPPSQLLKHCNSAVTFTYNLLNVTADSRICASLSSLPTTVQSSFRDLLSDLHSLFKGTANPSTRYSKVRHDTISYFVPLKSGGTLLVAVMRADPSGLPRIMDEFTQSLDARMRLAQEG